MSFIRMLILLPLLLLTSCDQKKTKSPGVVIILNGPSAVGKSSIIKAFQKQEQTPWLNVGIDTCFVGVIPPKFYTEDIPEHHNIMRGILSHQDGEKVFTLLIGTEGQKIIKGMHGAIAAYAQAGCNVIVDYIMYEPSWLTDLEAALADIPVVKVKVTGSLEKIEERERLRNTSPEGHARSIYKSVHRGWLYNLEINTDTTMPDQSADRISNYLKETLFPM